MMRPPRGDLILHDAEGFLRAQERAGEVGVDRGLPFVERQIFERHRGCADAGVVEQQIEPAECLLDACANSALIEAGSAMSAGTARLLPPAFAPSAATSSSLSLRRPASTTVKPAFISASAAARPTPVPAPVTSAIFGVDAMMLSSPDSLNSRAWWRKLVLRRNGACRSARLRLTR